MISCQAIVLGIVIGIVISLLFVQMVRILE